MIRSYWLGAVSLAAAMAAGCASWPDMREAEWVICSDSSPGACPLRGAVGLQRAIDAAADGAVIRLKPGVYKPVGSRDVAFVGAVPGSPDTYYIRGGIVVDGKSLSILGAEGVVFDNAGGAAVSAIVLHNAAVTLSRIDVMNYAYGSDDDAIYDGHGVFAINSTATLQDMTFEEIGKMAVAARGASFADLDDVRILNGHVGVWSRETAQVRARNLLMRNLEVTGVASYANSNVQVFNSVFDAIEDDAIYADGDASIYVTNSILLRNAPYALHAAGNGTIAIDYSGFQDNRAATFAEASGRVTTGGGVVQGDLKIDDRYAPKPDSPLIGKGNPMQQFRARGVNDIGLSISSNKTVPSEAVR